MSTDYSSELCRRLADVAEAQDLLRARRVTRHEAGEEVELALTGVAPAWKARARFALEKYVGGGFAGQVYRARALEVRATGPGTPSIEVGGTYALKMMVPWSRFGRAFRDTIYSIGLQAPFGLQVNPDAIRAAALWQKLLRRGARVTLGQERAVVDVHATFHDPALQSMGEVLEWVDGRVWRLEVNDRLFAKAPPPAREVDPLAPAGETEYEAKKAFMRQMVDLFHAMGAPELARQYEWWTMKSQPNVLKRCEAEGDPAAGLVAVDFGAGLALLPFLPMSPGDVKLILKGLARGRMVQFDRGDLERLHAFVAEHPQEFTDLGGAVAELTRVERVYHRSQPDLAHHGPRLVTDRALGGQIVRGFVRAYRTQGKLDLAKADHFRRRSGRALLFIALGILPILGPWLQRLWGNAAYRRHVARRLTSRDYFVRALRARQAEKLIDWHRKGRAGAERTERLLERRVFFWVEAFTLGLLPAGLHRFLSDRRFAWDVFRSLALRPLKLLVDDTYRRAWLMEMVEDGHRDGMLRREEADRILARIDEPYIQKYLKCLAVHVCTLPITQVVSMVVAGVYMAVTERPWSEAWVWAVAILAAFQITPISPGSLTRGGYVVWVMIRERNWFDYRLASAISFWKYIGYLGFPIQMASSYPVLAQFMATRWATGAVRIVPVFGERGALLEYGIFTTFFNVPISLGRRWREWAARLRVMGGIGSCGGIGRLPGPTGTYGSFAAAAVLFGLFHIPCPWWPVFIALFPLTALGVVSAGATEELVGRKDPKVFVLDEWIGMMIAALVTWAPGFLEGIATFLAERGAFEGDPAAWGAMGRGAWLAHLEALPGDAWAWASLGIAFVWFRVCDIIKPPPVRQVERLPGGWGIMADDVLAGAMALALSIVTVLALNAFV